MLLAVVAAYLGAAAALAPAAHASAAGPSRRRGPRSPSRSSSVGVVDWIVAAAVLYVLLPASAPVPFAHFVALFVVAQVAGVSSHVPGGLGVFETVMLLALRAARAGAGGGRRAARLSRRLLPAAARGRDAAAGRLRGAASGARAWRRRRALAGRWLPEVAPRVLAVAIFASGALLLFSGATPRHAGRLDWLRDLLPLPVLEASHFLASLVGVGLLLLARGLQRRLDAAYHLAVALLAAGAVLALLKGFDYEESLLLLGMLAALLPCRGRVPPPRLADRRALHRSAGRSRSSPCWRRRCGSASSSTSTSSTRTSCGGSSACSATRRASCAPASASAWRRWLLAGWHLLRPARLRAAPPDADEPGGGARRSSRPRRSPRPTSRCSATSRSCSATTGARSIMYAVSGRSCVAMGDPIGPPASCAELVWQFRELCDRHDTWPVFYEASAAALPLYLDVGLTPLKFGEEARVAARRRSRSRAARASSSATCCAPPNATAPAFEVCPPADVAALLPELRGDLRRLAAREADAREGLLARLLRRRLSRPVPDRAGARQGADRRLRQPVVRAPGTRRSRST